VEEVGQELCALLGGTKLIWLPGCPSEKMTHGHVDGIACFAKPGQVIAEVTADTSDPEYRDLQDNLERLKKAVDAGGQPLDLMVLQRPDLRDEWGKEFCNSYVNFYIANDAVIMPGFEDEHADAVAKAKLVQVFSPERKVEQIPIKHLAKGGGGIHCVTQQEPLV
jgi:agmatine deiminase